MKVVEGSKKSITLEQAPGKNTKCPNSDDKENWKMVWLTSAGSESKAEDKHLTVSCEEEVPPTTPAPPGT